jgi:hypothetical protein
VKIITVNLPEQYIKAIDGLVGEKHVYPSRSELIRVAVREFLIKELEAVKSFTMMAQKINTPVQVTTIQIPFETPEIHPTIEKELQLPAPKPEIKVIRPVQMKPSHTKPALLATHETINPKILDMAKLLLRQAWTPEKINKQLLELYGQSIQPSTLKQLQEML